MTPRDWSVFDRPGMRAAFATPGGHGCEVLIALDGIHCSACAARAEAAVAGRARDVRVDLAARTLSLRFEPDRTPLSAILRALDEAGLQPQLLANEEPTDRELRQRRLAVARVGVSTICAMQVMMMAWPGYFGIHPEPGIEQLLRWAQLAISIPGVLWAGWPLLAGGLQAVLRRSLDMNVPVALALATAFGASAVRTVLGAGDLYFDSATMFVWFLTLGRYLESRTRAQALGRTRLLAGRRALTALRRDDGGVHAVPIGELRAGDEVVVPPGEASPVDGGLLDSRADLDESLLTGESLPAVRRRDETVLAGAVNLGAAPLAVRTERIGTATMLAQITQLMQHAQDRKPRVQQVADGLAAHFVALVLLLALAGAGWAAAHGADVDRSMAIAIAVLVASCPCALSLAVPAALAAATSRLAGAGVLVANAGALQALARADTVVLDKTGTLTLPGMDLRRIEPRPQQDPARCAAIAAALEAGSRHPLASAFSGKACGMTAVDTEHLPGHGVSGTVEGRRYWLCAPEAAPDGSGEASRGAADEVHIVLHDGTRTLALFAIGARLRPEAQRVVSGLQHRGLAVEVSSGDSQEAVRELCLDLRLTRFSARQQPQQKLRRMQQLREQGRVVLAVGDGLNDAPLLAAADVSAAMPQGAALTQGRADLLLLGDSLAGLPMALDTARATARRIRENLAWAAAYNLVMLPLAVSGHLPPWLAAAGMSLSSLVVVGNAVRGFGSESGPRGPAAAPLPAAAA